MAAPTAPAAAPATPKHETVAKVGWLPGVFTMTRGELPVTASRCAEYAYLTRWYTEKETVRLKVELRRGAVTPGKALPVSLQMIIVIR